MPNFVYVIRPDGTVHYRVNWATPNELRKALTERDRYHAYENADLDKPRPDRGIIGHIRTMYIGGLLSHWDFLKEFPIIVRAHFTTDSYYRENGELKRRAIDFADLPPGDMACSPSEVRAAGE